MSDCRHVWTIEGIAAGKWFRECYVCHQHEATAGPRPDFWSMIERGIQSVEMLNQQCPIIGPTTNEVTN